MLFLVKQLKEGMLAVGAGLTHTTARVPVDRLAFSVDELAIALHVSLLQIRWQTTEIFSMGNDHMRAKPTHYGLMTNKANNTGMLLSMPSFLKCIHRLAPDKKSATLRTTWQCKVRLDPTWNIGPQPSSRIQRLVF